MAALGVPVVCIYGREDRDAACPHLAPGEAELIALAGGHHYGADPEELARALRASLAARGLIAARPPVGGAYAPGSGSEPSSTPSNSAVDR